MAGFWRDFLNQYCVHWKKNGVDEFGQPEFDSPVELKCRWDEMAEQFIDASGSGEVSKAKVMLESDFSLGDYLWFGRLSDEPDDSPLGAQGCWEVRGAEKTPNIDADDTLYIAIL